MAGRDHALDRVLPAHQGFHAAHMAALQIENRLEVDQQLILLDGLAQRGAQLHALARLQRQLLGVEGVGLSAAVLGLEQRGVGVADQLVELGAILGKQGDADAGGQEQRGAGDLERRVQALQHGFGQARGLLRAAAVLAEQGELVAAQARHGQALAHRRQALGHLLEHLVAGAVAEAFVDVLEQIQVQQQHAAPRRALGAALQGVLHALVEQQAVGQPGQRVVVGQVVQLLLGLLHGADVGEDRHIVGQFVELVANGMDPLPLRKDLAVLAAVPDLAAPAAMGLQFAPDDVVEAAVVTAGLEQAGRVAQHFGLGVAGDALEGPVHVNDAVLRVGDHHPFEGVVEHGGRLPQAVFMLAAHLQLVIESTALQAQEQVEQQGADDHEDQTLVGLPGVVLLAGAKPAQQQLVAEENPERGAQGIAHRQEEGIRERFHSELQAPAGIGAAVYGSSLGATTGEKLPSIRSRLIRGNETAGPWRQNAANTREGPALGNPPAHRRVNRLAFSTATLAFGRLQNPIFFCHKDPHLTFVVVCNRFECLANRKAQQAGERPSGTVGDGRSRISSERWGERRADRCARRRAKPGSIKPKLE